MAVVGFIDQLGERVTLEQAKAGEGSFPWPLPLTRALANGFRADDHYGEAGVISASGLADPPQMRTLLQRHDSWVSPLDSLWSTYGTIMHHILEAEGAESDWMIEEKMVIDFEGTKLGGTLDRFNPKTGVGQDWKVTSAYGVKKMLAEGVKAAKREYWIQANTYRYLLWKHGYETTSWELVLICRDYNARQHSAFKPVEVIQVELMTFNAIETYIRQRLMYHKAAELCDDADLPACTDAETWQGRRCQKWCAAADHCVQVHPELALTPADL